MWQEMAALPEDNLVEDLGVKFCISMLSKVVEHKQKIHKTCRQARGPKLENVLARKQPKQELAEALDKAGKLEAWRSIHLKEIQRKKGVS